MKDRYDTADNAEDEYYPGVSVLINLEDIRNDEDFLERETELQLAAYKRIFTSFDEGLTPTLSFFYYLHHLIFSPLFAWAGRPRTVGIAKRGTPFCPPHNIDSMMNALFAKLEQEQWLSGLDLDSFISRAAYYINTEFDRGLSCNFFCVEREQHFVKRREDAALSLAARTITCQIVTAKHNILRRHGDWLTAGRAKNVVGRQHQNRGFDLCFRRKRNVNSHLVPVEVGVECRTDERDRVSKFLASSAASVASGYSASGILV